MQTKEAVLQKLDDLIRAARRKGADAAEAVFARGDSLSVSWREGKIETLESSNASDLGLRVFIGKKQASCSTSVLDSAALEALVDRTVTMARAAPEDPFCGPAEPGQITKAYPALDLADDYLPKAEELIDAARAMEDAALAVEGVTQCVSANADASHANTFFAASNGFSGAMNKTYYSLAASALAGKGTMMEQDGEFFSTVYREDLPLPEKVGRTAGVRAVRNLGARKMPSCKAPVVFDPRESSGLLGLLVSAIKGPAIARGTSFMKDKLAQSIFSEDIDIIDDPFRVKGLRSRPFDGEGLLPSKMKIVEGGILKTWLLDLRSARQLGMQSTAHASRGTSSVPSPSCSNLYMMPGKVGPKELMSDIKKGFYVTETMGMGVNNVTGDYSMAARGFWIENGVLSFPVSEMTIAGNLSRMFLSLTAADDLDFRYGVDAPTIRIEDMTIAGT